MNLLHDNPALRLYALACSGLVLLLFWLAFHTGNVRTKRRAVVNAEDVRVYRDADVTEVEHPDVQRVKRAHLNLIENAVPFFIVGLLFALTHPPTWLAGALYFAFVLLRLLHVVFYLTARQPFRAATFGLGVFVIGGMLLLVVRDAF
jgi:prostaglandin-E synthase 1